MDDGRDYARKQVSRERNEIEEFLVEILGAPADVKREELKLDARRFTSTSACAREVMALLEHSDYTIIVRASARQIEELSSELEPIKPQWRISVEEAKS